MENLRGEVEGGGGCQDIQARPPPLSLHLFKSACFLRAKHCGPNSAVKFVFLDSVCIFNGTARTEVRSDSGWFIFSRASSGNWKPRRQVRK